MRRALVIAAVLLQVLALAGMAGKREVIRAYGQTIYLRTAPIDPRDPFRGDYVQLNYAMSSVRERDMRGTLAQHKNEKGTDVYAVLKPGNGDVYTLDHLTDQKPDNGVFIKGYTAYRWDYQPTATIKYDIEKYFVQQGKGLAMEKQLGARNTLQIPLEMQIAVGRDGTAVITGHRWSKLGVQLDVLRQNRQRNGQPEAGAPLSPKVKVTLKNVSDQPLTLANPGDNCAFELEWVSNGKDDYRIAENDCAGTRLTEKSLIQLKPDEAYTTDIDLSQPRWHIRRDNKLEEIGAIDGWQQFRLVYRSPGKEEAEQFADAVPFWLGELPTPAFNGRGWVD